MKKILLSLAIYFAMAANLLAGDMIVDGNLLAGPSTSTAVEKVTVIGGSIVIDNNQCLKTYDSAGTEMNMLWWDNSNIVHIVNNALGNGGAISFATKPGSAESMRIDSSGNVGIGTTNPLQKLTVAGTIESTTGGFKFPDGTIQGTAAAGAGGNLTEATSSVLTITGGTGAVMGSGTSIQVKQAGSAQDGYLSSADWGAFNGKQPSGNYITALTGDVTASGPGSASATIGSGSVTLSKMANLAANSVIGNNTGGPATPIALTTTQTKALLAIAESDVANLTTDLGSKVSSSTTVNGHPLSANVTVTKSDIGLGSVENTALSTWTGSSSITTLGNIGTGTWNGTAIANGKITSTLTGKTYNGLTLTSQAVGFTIAGGTTSKTLTLSENTTLSGTNSGDVTIGTANGLSLAGQVLSLSGTNSGDVTIGTANGLSLAGQVLSLGAATDSAAGALTSTDHAAYSGHLNSTSNPHAVTLEQARAADGTMSGIFSVNANSSAAPAAVGGTLFHLTQSDATGGVEQIDTFGGVGQIIFRRADGTNASKSAVAANSAIGGIYARPFTGSAYVNANRAAIALVTDEAQTSTANGTSITFSVTQNGTTTTSEAMRINNAGYVGIKTTAPEVQLDVAGWINYNGLKRVTTQFNKINATLQNVPGLPVTLDAGRTYSFRVVLFVDANATGGHKYAISAGAGTLTATNIIYQITSMDNGTPGSLRITSRQTSLGGSSGQSGQTSYKTEIEGMITVATAGTMYVQFAQNSASGTSSVLPGSYMILQDMP